MTTFQGTASYNGDLQNAAADAVSVHLAFPAFAYAIGPNGGVTRTSNGAAPVEFEHPLKADHYLAAFPDSALTGSDAASLAGFLVYTLDAQNSGQLTQLSLPVPASLGIQGTQAGATEFTALYYVGELSALSSVAVPLRGGKLLEDADSVAAHVARNLIVVNLHAFQGLTAEFSVLTGRSEPLLLVDIVAAFLAAIGATDPLHIDWSDEVNLSLRRVLSSRHLENQDRLVKFIREGLPKLFDFPLAVPPLDRIKVAGTFRVQTSDGSHITAGDLSLYALSVRLLLRSKEGAPLPFGNRLSWDGIAPPDAENKVPFALDLPASTVAAAVIGRALVEAKSWDGAVLWQRDFDPGDAALRELQIVVPLLRPAVLNDDPREAPGAGSKRLRGKVVTFSDECPLNGTTIVIQAKGVEDQLWRIVGAATAGKSGDFSLPYPYGKFVAAQALISLAPDAPADIPIVSGSRPDETISDDFLYLLVKTPECPHTDKEECDCGAPNGAPRIPDQSDLVGSDEYTQDIGGSCVNLSVPNRTLSEYSYRGIVRTSDPEVANYTLVKRPDGSFELQLSPQLTIRAPVSLENPIRWQDATGAHENLSFYQAATVATGHVLTWRAQFKADGYSLGELLYSLALAPGQKKQIVVMDASHRLQGTETQNVVQGESLSASLLNERDITDQLSGNLAESLRGSSSADTGGISAGLGVAAFIGAGAGALGVSGGYSSSSASASQDSSRNTAMFFGEKLRQAIMQNAQSYRNLNASVVTTVAEGQQYGLTTEVVANHNHCHALTMMYFEVLRHYVIEQDLAAVEECVFVPFLMTHFSRENIYKWSDVLAQSLLPMPASTYLQPLGIVRRRHPLLAAFDANERILTHYAHVDYPTGAFSDEPITSVTGYLTLRVSIPRPKTTYDRILSFPIVKREQTTNRNGGGVFGFIADVVVGENNVTMTWEEKVKFVDEHIVIYDNFQQARPADVIEVIKFDNLFTNGSKDGQLWTAIAELCGYSDVTAFLANYFAHKTISQWDAVYNDEIVPRVFRALVDNAITIMPFGACDFTVSGTYNGGERLIRLDFRTTTSLARKDIASVTFSYARGFAYAAQFWQFAKLNLDNAAIHYTTKHYQGTILNKSLVDDLNDSVGPVMTPMNSDEQRNPRKEDEYLVLKLLEHLNSNLEHYNRALLYLLDHDRRFMLLDGFNIQVFSSLGMPLPARSLASVVKNDLVAVVGNALVFPVAAGYRVSQSYITEVDEAGHEVRVDLIDHYRPLTPVPPYRISAPSRGVFIEAVQGACDACEKVKENSSQDWTKFTTDEPTAIVPVVTPTPQVTDWKAVFKDFAPPLVSIQNAPTLPDPGAGLSGLTELLGKAGIFKDITGLDQTQQNALKTYISNQDNARAFAEMAKTMAMQDHNTKNSDSIMNSLKAAKDSGALSDADYSKLVKDHLQQQIDGGQKEARADADAAKAKEVSPIQSAVELAKSGTSEVAATESDAQGNTKTLEVKQPAVGGSLKYDFDVPGTIEPLKQETEKACWATVATMISNWATKSSQSVDDYVKSVGEEYLPFIASGIPLDRLPDFCAAAGLQKAHSNACYPISFYYDALREHGPVWVIDLESDDPSMLHGRLLVGLHGDDTSPSTRFTVIDPINGTKYDETLETFTAKADRTVETLDAFPNAQIPLLIYRMESYDPASFDSGPAVGGTGTKPLAVTLYPSPSGDKLASNVKMQTGIDTAVTALETKYGLAAGSLPLSIAIAEITSAAGPFPSGGFKADAMHYIASEAKVCAMFAAYALRDFAQRLADAKSFGTQAELFAELKSAAVTGAILGSVTQVAKSTLISDAQRLPTYATVLTAAKDGGRLKVDITDAFKKSMREMIVPSNNSAAGACVRGIGYSYLNGALASAGYLDTSTLIGLWLAGDYSQETIWKTVRVPSDNDGPVGQAGTAHAMVEMVSQIWTKRVLTSDACDAMIALLHESVTAVDSDEPWAHRVHILPDASFVGNKLGLGPLKNGKQVRSEVTVLKDPGKAGHTYVLAWHNLIGIAAPIAFADVATLIKNAIDAYEA